MEPVGTTLNMWLILWPIGITMQWSPPLGGRVPRPPKRMWLLAHHGFTLLKKATQIYRACPYLQESTRGRPSKLFRCMFALYRRAIRYLLISRCPLAVHTFSKGSTLLTFERMTKHPACASSFPRPLTARGAWLGAA